MKAKPLAVTLAALLVMSVATFAIPAEAESIRTQITLGLLKNPDGETRGDPAHALPDLVRVGETRLVYGRIMQLPDGKNLQPLPNAPVKLVDVFNNAQNPIVLATATSDSDGFFIFEWKVTAKPFKDLGVFSLQEGVTSIDNLRLQVLGVFDGDATNAKSTSRGYIVQLKPLRLDINVSTDKRLYEINESARVTITFKDDVGQFVDPDVLTVFFGQTRILPIRESVGTYFFTTPSLSENIHRVAVIADKEEYLREVITATITASPRVGIPVELDIKFDQAAYGLGDSVVVSGTVRPALEGRAVLISIVNSQGSIYNIGRILPDADGMFRNEFRLVGPLATAGEWGVTTTYAGVQRIMSFNVGELPTQFMQISVESQSLVNDLGETLDEGSLGVPLGIQTELANNERVAIELTYIVQVKDANEFTVMVSWIRGVNLQPSASSSATVFWIPESRGDYSVEIFIWKSLEEPVQLSIPRAVDVTVA